MLKAPKLCQELVMAMTNYLLFLLPYIKFVSMKHLFKPYTALAVAAILALSATSCADDTIMSESQKLNTTTLGEEASTTIDVDLNASVQAPNIVQEGSGTRAIALDKQNLPILHGTELKIRIFIVRAGDEDKAMVNGKEAVDPNKVVLGIAEMNLSNVEPKPDGTIDLKKDAVLNFHWLNGKSATPKEGEKWYVCGIIGGEYNPDFDKARTDMSLDENKRKLAENLYRFYVDLDPKHTNLHNTVDAKGNILANVPFTTGWKPLVMQNGKIVIKGWRFKMIGNLIRFKVKRNTDLVKPEGHKYTFASSQITARGGFLMMPASLFRSNTDLATDHSFGLDCELRPWNESIENNFYWLYENDRQLHFNNPANMNPLEESADYGSPLYEYRYTFDASAMRKGKEKAEYDEFYVWGMPIPKLNYIGQTMLTAERGGFMLGRKRKAGTRYPYANEWLLAQSKPQEWTGEFTPYDFKSDKYKNSAQVVELGVCRPCFGKMRDGKPAYPWANPLERLAVTNSKTDEVGFHDTNTPHPNEAGYGWVSNWSLKSGDMKMRFALNNGTMKPQDYHLPTGEEWGLALPNILTSIYEGKLPIGLTGWDNIKSAPKPYFEMYDPEEDDMRPIISAGETHNSNKSDMQEERFWNNKPIFYSYFMQNKNRLELYAIRFDGNNKEAQSHKDRRPYGNRYRCAYRWRFMDAGGPDVTNDGRGMRLVVQSRWIGNANVTVRDIMDDKWWGECSDSNPLYLTDCYRVLPCVGFPFPKGAPTWRMAYWSRTRWKHNTYDKDDAYSNKTFCYRVLSKDGFDRGHNDNATLHYGVRLMVNRDVDEFGKRAPRQLQKDKDEQRLIHRK